MVPKNNGKRNRTRGHSYERKIAQEFREMGWEKACTTRYASRMRDDQKVDIFDVDPFNVQCKATNKCINYKQVLSEMPNDNNYNVVFNKLTGKGDFVIMVKEDFYELISTLKIEGIL
jgi:hypothetical protein